MRVAFWRYGGEPRPTRITIFAPCHRLQRAGINTSLWPSIACADQRFGLEPIAFLAGRTMHRCCRGYGEQNPVTSVPPHIHPTESLKLIGLHRSLLRKRCANSPAPWNVAPRSRKRASNRSPARSTKVRPPRSTSRAVPGDVKNPKSSAHEPTSRPVNLTVMRSSRRIIESISTNSVIANELPN